MRLRIDTSGVKFRVAGLARPRMESRERQVQKTTPKPDSRPIWVVKLTAIDSGAGESGSVEAIWVEVAAHQAPALVLDELAVVQGLTYQPWVSTMKKKPEIVRAFRAESISMADAGRRAA